MTVEDRYHQPLEEYLETIYSLQEEGTPVIQARIAERLGRSAPSVSEMLDRLADEGYVGREGRVVDLTKEGNAVASRVVRRHRLAERFLVDIIGLPWHKAHLEAGVWEHVISDDVEERLVVILNNPSTCPHGNPIPGRDTPSSTLSHRPLSDAVAGTTIRLERISEDIEIDIGQLRYLDEHGFTPGSSAVVSSRAPDGTILLQIDGSTVAIGSDLSRRLFVAAAS
jgi:DtxR family Mn-dependent transcriptional regulator